VLLIPTLAALGLGSLRMASALSDSAQATRAASIANALPDSFSLALQLQVERETGSVAKISAKSLDPVRQSTDHAIKVWRSRAVDVDSSHDAALRDDLRKITGALDDMSSLRAHLADPRTRLLGQTEYTNTLNLLLGLASHLPEVGSSKGLYRQALGLGQVRTAAEAIAAQRILVTKAIGQRSISQFDLTSLAAATQSFKDASGFFRDNTSPKAQRQFDLITSSEDGASTHAGMQAAIETIISTGNPVAADIDVAHWNTTSAAFLGLMTSVVSTAAQDLAKAVDARRAAAQHDALISAATVLVVLLFALIATVVVARSILRPLHRLRDAALDIARHELPDRVREMEESEKVEDLEVQPIVVGSRDEIAEVAEAFDAVHGEAIRLAGEQAQMRANVNRMFVNLSRRSQSLVERQLRLIDELESGEQDPEHLANLFRLDHLATRMRRNDESLMVLAGGDTGQGARGPVPVLDVLRAASSEVEQFARVEIESGESAKFRGSVAGDLVHLLAELIENATNFSPPDSTVVVRSTRTSPASPLVIEIRDLGIGMSPVELDAANQKLRSAGGLDADVARMMGLVVASRLADRHGLTVELRANSPRGTVARVEVPTSVLVEPEARPDQGLDVLDPALPVEALMPSPARPEQLRLPEEPLAPLAPAAFAPSSLEETPDDRSFGSDPLTDPYSDEPAAPAAFTESGIPTLPKRNPSMVLPADFSQEAPVDPAPAAPAAAPEELSAPEAPAASAAPAEPAPAPEAPAAAAPEPPTRSAVRPPDNYTPPAKPIASEPPVKSWFTTTVPLRDPEELLNTYLTGRAEGVDGAIKNPVESAPKSPLGSIAKRAQPVVDPFAAPQDPTRSDLFLPSKTEELPPAPPAITSSGLPTRVPRSNLPAGLAGESTFNAFGSGTPATPPSPRMPAEPVESVEPAPVAQPAVTEEPAALVEPVAPEEPALPTEPVESKERAETAPATPTVPPVELLETLAPDLVRPVATKSGPVLDPLIAELAADVLNAPSAAEALNRLDEEDGSDDSSIFATLQSEWFTRRTPLEARRSQSELATNEPAAKGEWVSPGDEGWRRAAELADPAAGQDDSRLTVDGLPVRVPGRNLVPGSAAAAAETPEAVPENVVPLPRLERRRTRGLSSFQQGVSRARTTDTPDTDDHSEEITVLGAYDASQNRAHEEHQ